MPLPNIDDEDFEGEDGDDENRVGYEDLMGGHATGAPAAAGPPQQGAFERVVGEMVVTGRIENHPPENLLMEIKGVKFAQNKVHFFPSRISMHFNECRYNDRYYIG